VKAFRLLEAEQSPMHVHLPKTKAGSGQVVNKVVGAGLCHTELALMCRKKALHALALGIERIGLVSLRFPLSVAPCRDRARARHRVRRR
jgi:D-arabinose 1-dehydrogenase-like Zn-dependent alcohol dehydrogenase